MSPFITTKIKLSLFSSISKAIVFNSCTKKDNGSKTKIYTVKFNINNISKIQDTTVQSGGQITILAN